MLPLDDDRWPEAPTLLGTDAPSLFLAEGWGPRRLASLARGLSALLSSPRGALFVSGGPETGPLLCVEPRRWWATSDPQEALVFLQEMEVRRREGAFLAGWLSYEFGYCLEPALADWRKPGPLLEVGDYRPCLSDQLPAMGGIASEISGPFEVSGLSWEQGENDYLAGVRRILEAIAAGDVYQVNLTSRLTFHLRGHPTALFLQLLQGQPTALGAVFRNGDQWTLCLSPELLVEWRGTRLTMKPMKGTTARGRTLEEDQERCRELVQDVKQRAENLMIADLVRNDLGRLAKPGQVRAVALFTAERWPTVWQMTSTIEATAPREPDLVELFRSILPAGSVTGAPKIAAARYIAELEGSSRGPYCGALGWIHGRGGRLAVGIRTLHLRRVPEEERIPGMVPQSGSRERYLGTLGVGSGIVADSSPREEWEECRLKAQFVVCPRPAFAVVETMAWHGTIPLLGAHLQRMRATAEYFGFPFSESAARAVIATETAGRDPSAPLRIRLLLDADGHFRCEVSPLELPAEPVKLRFAEQQVDPKDPWLYHKTTWRPLYQRERAAARKAGYWDAIFLNTAGLVTEGTICNLFARVGSRWLTPPVECGLLPGVMRSRMIRELPADEVCLCPEDLLQAEALLVTNAVVGVVRAVLEPRASETAGFVQ